MYVLASSQPKVAKSYSAFQVGKWQSAICSWSLEAGLPALCARSRSEPGISSLEQTRHGITCSPRTCMTGHVLASHAAPVRPRACKATRISPAMDARPLLATHPAADRKE